MDARGQDNIYYPRPSIKSVVSNKNLRIHSARDLLKY